MEGTERMEMADPWWATAVFTLSRNKEDKSLDLNLVALQWQGKAVLRSSLYSGEQQLAQYQSVGTSPSEYQAPKSVSASVSPVNLLAGVI